jgi:putative salt-induced outer membrane protein YdiY
MMTIDKRTMGMAIAVALLYLIGAAASAWAQAPAPAGPPPTWTGSAGAGLAVTSGNSDTMNYNFGFDVTRTPMGRNVMKWTGLYLRGDQNDVIVVNRTSLAFRDEFTYSGRTFFFGQIDYLRDTFKLIDYLVAPTIGVGYKIMDADPARLSVDGGAGTISEQNPGPDVRISAALTASEKLQLQLTPTALLKHTITGLWKVDDLEDGLYTFTIGLATQISPRMLLSVDLLDSFKSKPPTVATKKNDVALVTAITAKF